MTTTEQIPPNVEAAALLAAIGAVRSDARLGSWTREATLEVLERMYDRAARSRAAELLAEEGAA